MNRQDLRAIDYVGHILDGIKNIETYTRGLTHQEFVGSRITQDAVVWNFTVIGEASRNLLRHFPDFVAAYPDLRLASAYGMRNRLAHGYHKISVQVVWKTLREDLPVLRRQVEEVLAVLCEHNLGEGQETGTTADKTEHNLTTWEERRKGAEDWLKFRAAQRHGGEKTRAPDHKEKQREKAPRDRGRGLDDDF